MNDLARQLASLFYLTSVVLFLVGLKQLAGLRTARRGNGLAMLAMLLALIGAGLEREQVGYVWVLVGLVVGAGVGAVAAVRVPMTGMPGLVGLFNGLGGAASTLIAVAFLIGDAGSDSAQVGCALASILIGGVTFSGSMVAFVKVQELVKDRPVLLPMRHLVLAGFVVLSAGCAVGYFFTASAPAGVLGTLLVVLPLALGVLFVLPIGGADMPVVIALLNAFSGLATSATGFVLRNPALVVAGALVGASGVFLTHLMCEGMNRTLLDVVRGGFGGTTGAGGEYKRVQRATADDAAVTLEQARRVVVVPGYGMAVARAQHVVRELTDWLQRHDIEVSYAVHPVAGRLPGHMNVLLAEAEVPYEQLVEMDKANPEFRDTDVVLVVGANDVVNPAAEGDKTSPLFGMPILQVHRARTVFVIKRSLGSGFAGVKNELFEYPNTHMLLGDAREVLGNVLAELKQHDYSSGSSSSGGVGTPASAGVG